MKSTMVVLQTRNPTFARAAFLTNSEQAVQTFLENAFVFEGVQWWKVDTLTSPQKHPQLHALSAQYQGDWEQFFTREFKWTLVPFEVLPAPVGFKYTDTDIARRLVKTGLARNSQTGQGWGARAGALLLDRVETMSIKVKGVWYPTPCQACSHFFGHLAGQCKLIQINDATSLNRRPKSAIELCHMPLFERSEAAQDELTEGSPDPMAPVYLD